MSDQDQDRRRQDDLIGQQLAEGSCWGGSRRPGDDDDDDRYEWYCMKCGTHWATPSAQKPATCDSWKCPSVAKDIMSN